MKFLTGGISTSSSSMQIFSASSLFSAYASLTALVTLIQQFYNQFIPKQVREYITIKIEEWFTKTATSTTSFTLVIEQFDDVDYDSFNQVFDACEAYLSSKLRVTSTCLKVSRPTRNERVSFKLAQGETYSEDFDGVQLKWSFICNNNTPNNSAHHNDIDDGRSYKGRGGLRTSYFELTFEPQHKDKVFDEYLPYILKFYDELIETKKELRLFTLDCGGGKSGAWRSVKFKHPFTFDALAMEPEVKNKVIDDLDRFLKRRDFYKKVGRAWKRGYLLYGPPGTGKSSLIAAMANYLNFDIYDLQLSSVHNDSVLRRLLLSTSNKSILVIEDIDCSMGLADRQIQLTNEVKEKYGNEFEMDSQISLSGLLNFIDGLWSSCGDERIFVFTTNHKEKLDPALLRPGRMDMHVHMSYLTMPAFKILAHNYLNITGDHHLFKEIEVLIQTTNVSPAQVAEELIRSDDPDVVLSSLIQLLKNTNVQQNQKTKVEFPKWINNGIVGNGLGNLINGVIDHSSEDFSSD